MAQASPENESPVRSRLGLRIGVAVVDLACGGASVGLGGAHLFAVLSGALAGQGHGGAPRFVYDFHFVSLVGLGLLLVIPGLLCVVHAVGIARGRRGSWNAATRAALLLAVVNGALLPVQGFAVLLGALAGLDLAVLLLLRRSALGPVAAKPVV